MFGVETFSFPPKCQRNGRDLACERKASRRALLPRLFDLTGLDQAKEGIERVIQITRVGLSRGLPDAA
jgi:hypothetical protein